MTFTHLTENEKQNIIYAYQDKDFAKVKLLCFEYKTMTGCANCSFDIEIAALHIDNMINN